MRRRFEGEQYFEDFTPGEVYVTDPIEVDADEAHAFAARYDPQPFHLDDDAAARGPFGGMAVSGWFTVSLIFGHLIRSGFLRGGGWGAGTIDQLRWKKPVRPGDRLTAEARVLDKRESRTRPDRGYVTIEIAVIDQDGDEVLTLSVPEILKKRQAA